MWKLLRKGEVIVGIARDEPVEASESRSGRAGSASDTGAPAGLSNVDIIMNERREFFAAWYELQPYSGYNSGGPADVPAGAALRRRSGPEGPPRTKAAMAQRRGFRKTAPEKSLHCIGGSVSFLLPAIMDGGTMSG